MSFDDFLQKQSDREKGRILHEFRNERGDKLIIFNDHIELDIQPIGWFNFWPNAYGTHRNGLKKYMPFTNMHVNYESPGWGKYGSVTLNNEGRSYGFRKTCIYIKSKESSSNKRNWNEVENLIMKAKVDYEKSSNQKTVVQGNYVHGDYVDDRDTIIKDSVINRSNIGAPVAEPRHQQWKRPAVEAKVVTAEPVREKSKGEQIKVIKDLLDSGAIDDAEFKQMKKEILGK